MTNKQRQLEKLKNKYRKDMQLEQFRLVAEEITPYLYASVCMAMVELTDMNEDDIKTIFAKSQEIWNGEWPQEKSPLDVCYEKTGIFIANERIANNLDALEEE